MSTTSKRCQTHLGWNQSIYDDKHSFVFDKRGIFYDLQRDLSQVDCLDDSILLAIQVSWVASIIHEETLKKARTATRFRVSWQRITLPYDTLLQKTGENFLILGEI